MLNLRIAVIALMLAATSVTGCANTWHGAGQDVERAGESMQKSVEE